MLDAIIDRTAPSNAEVKAALPEGGLRDQHVYELVDLIAKRRKRSTFSIDLTLYAFLFHLKDGPDAKFPAVPEKANEAVLSFGLFARSRHQSYKTTLSTLVKEQQRAPAHLQAVHAERTKQHG